MMLPSRLGCPMSQKTPNMGNPGLIVLNAILAIGAISNDERFEEFLKSYLTALGRALSLTNR